MSKRTTPAIKDLIVEPSQKGKYVSEIVKCTNKPWSTCKKTKQKYWEAGSTENTFNNIRQVKCTARDFITNKVELFGGVDEGDLSHLPFSKHISFYFSQSELKFHPKKYGFTNFQP